MSNQEILKLDVDRLAGLIAAGGCTSGRKSQEAEVQVIVGKGEDWGE